MIDPQVLALLIISYLSSAYLIYAASYAIGVLKKWDLSSGSEEQIRLEKKTYLIETIIFWISIITIISLFLFMYEVDALSNFIKGAMCGFGTLHMNIFGWGTFFLKLAIVILSGLWLVINSIDNKYSDYPLIKQKSIILISITPFFVLDSLISSFFFLNIKPDIIVSCCGSFFNNFGMNENSGNFKFLLSKKTAFISFIIYQGIIFSALIFSLRSDRGTLLSGFLATINIFIISYFFLFYVSPFIYEMPNHFCPFCMLKIEYKGVGYLYYLFFLLYSLFSISLLIIYLIQKRQTQLAFLLKYKKKQLVFITSLLLTIFVMFIYSIYTSNLKFDY
ncbi:MAG: hypothetical protein N2202_07905 [Proteobacteria bacterium]|nr:hypothetical protein [Pseudomonadota bacterium]